MVFEQIFLCVDGIRKVGNANFTGSYRSLRRKILMIFETKYGLYGHMIGAILGECRWDR